MAEVQNALFQWRNDEDLQASYGEGVSRPRHNARLRDYTVLVKPPQAPAFKWFTRAENRRAVIRYAQNRWPDCKAELL